MMARNYTKSKISRFIAVILIVILVLSNIPQNIRQSLAEELPDVQESVEVHTDGLEYQTITTQPGETDTELVKLDGLMPVNAEVNVQSSQEYTNDNLFAYDISITNQSGEEFQPESGEPIKVEITNTAISDAQETNRKFRLWHIDNDGLREEIKNFEVKDDKIIFEASGFSVYELDDGTPYLRTYEFWMQDRTGNYARYYFPTNSQDSTGSTASGYKEVCSQTIKNNEKLIFPQLPADMTNRYTFIGWRVGSSTGDTLDFDNIPAITQTETVKLYAAFEPCVYAVFHDQYNDVTNTYPVFATRRNISNSYTFNISDLEVKYYDPNKHEGDPPSKEFAGWVKNPNDTIPLVADNEGNHTFNNSDLTDGAIHLYPVFDSIRWIIFDSNATGATYISPKHFKVADGYDFSSISPPTRTGYVFDGWYTENGTQVTDAENHCISGVNTGGVRVENGKLYIDGSDVSKKLYAKWKEANTKYTVIIWKQKATDSPNLSNGEKSYDFAESISLYALTGSTVFVDSQYKQKNYVGFQYGHCDPETTTTVSGNGKTVLNVYYDRKEHTLTFKNNNNTTVKTITALYGSYIKDNFPIPGYENYIWTDQGNPQVYSYVLATIETMPDANVTFSGTYRKANETAYYYVEIDAEDASDYTTTYTFNSTLYGLYKTVEHGFYRLTYDEEYHPIEGYIRDRSWAIPYFGEPGRQSNSNQQVNDANSAPIGGYASNSNTNSITGMGINYLFYNRDTFSIKFIDSQNANQIAEVSVKYQQKLESKVPTNFSVPEGYSFSGWYADSGCTTRVFFHQPTPQEISGISNYQVCERMPATNLRVYAGWEPNWCRIEIDPNGGTLLFERDSNNNIKSLQSTFFWETYGSSTIEEYELVSRDYEEDVNGDYYYVKHDRAYYGLGDNWSAQEDSIQDRAAYYTEDRNEATDATRYKWSPNAYRYIGTYRVDPLTGKEEPYNFSEQVQGDVFLRMHWKHLETFFIKYDAGAGTLDKSDHNEVTFQMLDSNDYADHASVIVTRTVAQPPAGKNFTGWRIKNDSSGKVYYPGKSFELEAAYAEAISTVAQDGSVTVRRTITLEAVYEDLKTAEIIYDANGGEINNVNTAKNPDNAGGQVRLYPVNEEDYYSRLTTEYSVDTVENQLKVSDLLNNSAVKLSNGEGFYNHGYEFLGWSTEKDGSKNFYDKQSITTARGVDVDEPTVLYAQWAVKVYFDRNDITSGNTYYWGNGTGNDWGNGYTYDAAKKMYYTTINLNAKVGEPSYTPTSYTPTSNDTEEVFSHWSLEKQTNLNERKDAFEFNNPVTQVTIDDSKNDGRGDNCLILHACWRAPIKIPVYFVDTSNEPWVKQDTWRKDGDDTNIVLRDSTPVYLNGGTASSYANANLTSEYKFAFATTAGNGNNDYQNITDTIQITEIWYDSDDMCVKVKYSDNTIHDFDAVNNAVYLVYYKGTNIPVKYRHMENDVNRELESVNVNSNAPTTATIPIPSTDTDSYKMQDNITSPLAWANNNYNYYSFAVGKTNAANASELKVITASSTSDSDIPELQVRKKWNGYEYSLDGSDWYDCGGYDIALYTIYYDQIPTIVTLTEKTIALPEKMEEEFEYTIKITQTELKTVTRKFGYYNSNNQWRDLNTGNYVTTNNTTSEETVILEIPLSSPLELSDGESDSYVLFFSSPGDTTTNRTAYVVNGVQQTCYANNRWRDVYYQDTTTNQKISQTITINQTENTDFTTSNDAVSGDTVYNSSYTSSASNDPVTITYTNKRKLQKEVNVALSGSDKLTLRNDLRTDTTSIYQHDFSSSDVWNVSDTDVISPAGLINNIGDYIFIGIITGKQKTDSNEITPIKTEIESLSFGEISSGEYNYYLNDDTSMILNEQEEIYFVYAKKPTIQYMYEKPEGGFEPITVFERNGVTFTRTSNAVTQNPIAQEELLPVTADGLLISQISTPSSRAFEIPGDLDYDGKQLRIDLNRLCVGENIANAQDTGSKSMKITLTPDGKMQYSANGTAVSFPENPVVYAIYRIKGYELTVSKQVKGNSTVGNFTFEISSDVLSGEYATSTGTPVTASDKKITITVPRDGSVTIYGLSKGTYVVTETTPGDYEMTAKVNGIDMNVTATKVAALVESNTTVAVLNTYPIPVTGVGERTAPYVVVMILTTAALVCIYRRKEEKQNENSSL